MNVRHLYTRGFDEETYSKSIIYEGNRIIIPTQNTVVKSTPNQTESLVNLNSIEDEIKYSDEFLKGKDAVLNSPLAECFVKEPNKICPLSQIFGYKITEGCNLHQAGLPIGATFKDIFENPDTKDWLSDIALTMFNHTDIRTGEADIEPNAWYTPYIPLTILTGCVTPQKDNKGNSYFNPYGTVSVAEFIDGLNSIKYGCNANRKRRKSLDNVSDVDDYFNEGYQSCLKGFSSPFYNLYTREELLKPITRVELAYITVICWERYIEMFENLYGGTYYLGVNFDWENPAEECEKYADGQAYKVSKIEFENQAVSLNIKDYKGDFSMTEYKERIKSGKMAIPLPLYMSLLEICNIGLLDLELLEPMKEVSRAELSYFLTELSNIFQTIR